MGVWGWDVLDHNAELRGVLRSYPGPPHLSPDDGDWCWFVEPDMNGIGYLTNPHGGHANTNHLIECEVAPPLSIGGSPADSQGTVDSYLAALTDRWVTVQGTWSIDKSHDYGYGTCWTGCPDDGKTEIHPITSVLGELAPVNRTTRRWMFSVFSDRRGGTVPGADTDRTGTCALPLLPDATPSVHEYTPRQHASADWKKGIIGGTPVYAGTVRSGTPSAGEGFYHAVITIAASELRRHCVVRLGNGDDRQRVLVNGDEKGSAGFNEQADVDLGMLEPQDDITIEVTNNGGGYTWGFDLITDGVPVYSEWAGRAGQVGAVLDDQGDPNRVVRRVTLSPSGAVVGSEVISQPAAAGLDFRPPQELAGAYAAVGPSLAVHAGQLHIAWRGFDQGIYWAHFDDTTGAWTAPERLQGGCNGTVALASDGNDLVLAWRGYRSDQTLWFSTFDGSSWTPQQHVLPGAASLVGPAMAGENGGVWMTWRGAANDETIYVALRPASGAWAAAEIVPNAASSYGPAIVLHNGQPRIAWKGAGNDTRVFYSVRDGAWSSQAQIPGAGTTSGPALASFRGDVYAAWTTPGAAASLWWSRTGLSGDWDPIPRAALGSQADQRPALAAHADLAAHDRLFMAWKGAGGWLSPIPLHVYWSTFLPKFGL